ncbi:MAG TPA: hypothetical protein VMU71_02725 [Terracidiphilus sp.]|nr:hypothetical protein [Terracidiphilus sp.]
MPSTQTSASAAASRPAAAIFWAGLIAGAMDISAAILVYGAMGARPIPLLQGIAAGLLGMRAFSGGLATAALGLLCHFAIAYGAAATYIAASRIVAALARRPFLFGPLYGIAVYFFMQWIVQHSRAIHRPFSMQMTLVGCAIHIVCVGSPIALVNWRFTVR